MQGNNSSDQRELYSKALTPHNYNTRYYLCDAHKGSVLAFFWQRTCRKAWWEATSNMRASTDAKQQLLETTNIQIDFLSFKHRINKMFLFMWWHVQLVAWWVQHVLPPKCTRARQWADSQLHSWSGPPAALLSKVSLDHKHFNKAMILGYRMMCEIMCWTTLATRFVCLMCWNYTLTALPE